MLSNDRQQQLLLALNDGAWHSGEVLAHLLSADHAVSRMTISNDVRQLLDAGYPIERKHGQGYRLAAPLPLMDAVALGDALGLPVDMKAVTASTNDLARNWLSADAKNKAAVFVAGYQKAGRGRMERKWQAQPCAGLLCSLAWRFERFPPDLPALSLVVGLALAKALVELGVAPAKLGIKWPNDVLLDNRKLAGVLIEANVQQEAVSVAIGLGVNVSAAPEEGVRYPAAYLQGLLPAVLPGQLLVALTGQLIMLLEQFSESGFAGLRQQYLDFDVVVGRRLELDEREILIAGVDSAGALEVQEAGVLKRYVSGELSLPWPS